MKTVRIVVALAFAVTTLVALAPRAEARGMGSQPLDDIRFWADQKKACGLTRDQLAAMMMAVTYPEAGATGEQAPSPMTLSRYDTHPGLYVGGDRNTPWQKAFWHPGVGMWAFDSSGGWDLTAVGAISTWTSAAQAATTMAARWCANPSRAYVWAPWFACGSGVCETIYNNIFDGTQLRNITLHPSVTRDGGMEPRTCTINGRAVFCWYVDPSRAQGANWWVNPSAGPSPISAPFYVVSENGRETRYWLAQDTGFLLSLRADKPVTANARTSLNWAAVSELCDVTAARGDCGNGPRVARTPWGDRVALPFGSFDSAVPGLGVIDASGWVIDPDTNDAVPVHVYIDGQFAGSTMAANARPDVGGAVPGYGDRHGFAARFRAGGGNHQVCAFAINIGTFGNDNPVLGCRQVTVSANPTGSFDGWAPSSPGIRVSGWAVDPDSDASVGVHVYVDGRFAGQGVASGSRPDVGDAFGWVGNNRGFDIEAAALPGPHNVCVYALNLGPGGNNLLGCRSVNVPDRNPFGSFDGASRVGGGVRAAGWTIDPDLVFPIEVHVYVNGAFAAAVPATVNRPDVGAVFPIFGPHHGFDVTVAAPPGPVQVCVFAINWGPGWTNPLLGCRAVA
jgi:hypothetical protein